MRITILTLFLAARLGATGVNFIPNDLATARSQAQREGKLILVDFCDDRIASCQAMQRTWEDNMVGDFVKGNCVATRLDNASEEGKLYRKFFGVTKLPTILLLDACGNEVSRRETTMTSIRLIQWVSFYNNEQNRACPEGGAVALPTLGVVGPQLTESETAETPVADTPVAPDPEPIATEPAAVATYSQPIFRPTRPTEMAVNTSPAGMVDYPRPPEPLRPEPATLTLSSAAPASVSAGRIMWEMTPKGGFSVQVIACSTSEGAAAVKENCLRQFNVPVAVVPPAFSGDGLYRVVVGFFEHKSEAENLKSKVRRTFGDAFVKGWRQ